MHLLEEELRNMSKREVGGIIKTNRFYAKNNKLNDVRGRHARECEMASMNQVIVRKKVV